MGNIWGGTQRIGDYFSLKGRNEELALENHELRLKLAQMEQLPPEKPLLLPEEVLCICLYFSRAPFLPARSAPQKP